MNIWTNLSKYVSADNPQDTFDCVCVSQILKKKFKLLYGNK